DAWGFDAGRQAIARRLRTMRLRLSVVRSVAFIALAAFLILGGSAGFRNAVLSFLWPGWASTIVFLVGLFGLIAVVEFPFGVVSGYRWEKASGLSSQTLAGWLKDFGKSLGLGLGASIVMGGAVLWLLAASPTWWWLIAWALELLVSAILAFIAPVVLVPLFFRFRPLADASLRSRFEALAAKAKVPIL